MTQSLTELSNEVSAVLRDELAQLLECEPAHVDLTTRLTELPGIDSMRLVQAVVNCQERWGIVLDEDELVEVRSGADLADLIVYTMTAGLELS
jgi:acyl carrier protein